MQRSPLLAQLVLIEVLAVRVLRKSTKLGIATCNTEKKVSWVPSYRQLRIGRFDVHASRFTYVNIVSRNCKDHGCEKQVLKNVMVLSS